MSKKPFTLTVHPRLEDTNLSASDIHQGRWTERQLSGSKRLTEAELAAEFEAARCDWMLTEATGSYWSPLGDTWPHDPDSVSRRVQALLRFAARPHYDEPAT